MLEHFRILEMRVDAKHAVVTEVLAALEATLDLSQRQEIPIIFAPACCFTPRTWGRYAQHSRHIELCVNESSLAVTALHEVGHALDHLESNTFASASLLTHWQAAVPENPCFERLDQQVKARVVGERFFTQQEILARSFEQWCVENLQLEVLQQQWNVFLEGQPLVEKGLYWTKEEFLPIQTALEADFEVWGIPRKNVANSGQISPKRVNSKVRKAR